MKTISLFILFTTIFVSCNSQIANQDSNKVENPIENYLNILTISSSRSFVLDQEYGLRYRLLVIASEAYSSLMVEIINIGMEEGDKISLFNSYDIENAHFGDDSIFDINILEWLDEFQVKVLINNKACFLLKLGINAETTVIAKCDS